MSETRTPTLADLESLLIRLHVAASVWGMHGGARLVVSLNEWEFDVLTHFSTDPHPLTCGERPA